MLFHVDSLSLVHLDDFVKLSAPLLVLLSLDFGLLAWSQLCQLEGRVII